MLYTFFSHRWILQALDGTAREFTKWFDAETPVALVTHLNYSNLDIGWSWKRAIKYENNSLAHCKSPWLHQSLSFLHLLLSDKHTTVSETSVVDGIAPGWHRNVLTQVASGWATKLHKAHCKRHIAQIVFAQCCTSASFISARFSRSSWQQPNLRASQKWRMSLVLPILLESIFESLQLTETQRLAAKKQNMEMHITEICNHHLSQSWFNSL